ncbi:MAG: hypothetical protein LUD15_06190 [Bacteroides sp.]|nr:hypothetical protein [Bacteroides sp.]
MIKNYDPAKVHSICSGAVIQTSANNKRVATVRAEIMNLLSNDKKNFREVVDKLKTGNILSVAESCGLALAESFFTDDQDNQATITGYEKLIGVNIIRKLQDEFNSNPAGLKNKLSRLVKYAAVMAKHHPSEINDGPSIRESMFVILLDYKDDEAFLKEVTRTIESLSPQGTCKVSTGGNHNEIVVINLESNLTPRYLKSVEVLRNSYDRLMGSAQDKVARFETQLEDYESLPSLYKPTDEELQRQKEEMQKSNPELTDGSWYEYSSGIRRTRNRSYQTCGYLYR